MVGCYQQIISNITVVFPPLSRNTRANVTQKSAYKRPYKTRQQRREHARRNHDVSNDYRFLVRAAIAIGLVAIIAVGFAAKGLAEHDPAVPVAAFR